MQTSIVIKGARVHNLKNIDITIPRDKLVVMTGLSGSGKSSLAFDTIYAEGHRRFVESLSSYARMFLGQMDKPDVDMIEGLSPAISIDQKTTSRNPRSTVGTVTEIYDYLRLLYARVGIPHCPICGREIRQQSVDQIIDKILTLPEGTRFLVLSPVVRAQKGMHEKVLADAKKIALDDAGVNVKVVFTTEELVAGGIKSPYYYFAFESASARWTYKINAVLGVIMDKTCDKIIPPAPEFIGLEKAKQIALDDAGLDETAQKIVFTKEVLSRNSGKPCYILEFYTDKCAYSYKVDAVSGDIIGKKTD